MKTRLRLASIVLGVAVLATWLVAGVAASASSARIVSVTFTGGQAKPTVVIRGQHLGKRPHPDPAYHPLGHPPLCPPTATKPLAAYGFDYGTSLYLEDTTQNPTWSAGRYRPAKSELDCVGVVVVKFTPSQVVFRLGAFYTEARLKLAPGDAFTVGVGSARFHGHVRYR